MAPETCAHEGCKCMLDPQKLWLAKGITTAVITVPKQLLLLPASAAVVMRSAVRGLLICRD
jgi:hypothetical protein